MQKNFVDGQPCEVKVSCTVRSGGKFGDNIKGLPIAIKLFQLRESGKDFPILEVLYSLKSLGSLLFSNLSFYSLRTSGDCSITKEGLRSRRSSERWMDWGMMWNGRCLTQRPTFPKAVNGSSLSDILETHVPNKYFLSLDRLQHLIKTSETC